MSEALDKIIGTWCASTDEEDWNGCETGYATREEAIDETIYGLGIEEGDCFWVGVAEKFDWRDRLNEDSVAEHLLERLAEDEDCYIDEDWLHEVSKEENHALGLKLKAALEEWFREHPKHAPGWFTVPKAECYTVTAADVEKAEKRDREEEGEGS